MITARGRSGFATRGRRVATALRTVFCPQGIVLTLLTLARAPLPAQTDAAPPSGMIVEGEELVYNVRYAFVNLGQVKVRVLKVDRTPSSMSYTAKAFIDSYRGIPFVDLHAVFESTVDSLAFSRNFTGKSKEGDLWDFYRYDFQYDRNRVLIEFGKGDTTAVQRETLDVHAPYNDGLSLLFFAREQLYCGKSVDVPTLIKNEKVNTRIDFTEEHTDAEIDAVDYPVDAVKFEGNAGFVGLYGLSGDFEGWFSNDAARVPILAKMKVIVGKITIELMSWKRPGWAPPRAKG